MSIAGELRRETNALVYSVTLGSGALLIFSLAQIVEYVVMVARAVGRLVAQQNCEDVRLSLEWCSCPYGDGGYD